MSSGFGYGAAGCRKMFLQQWGKNCADLAAWGYTLTSVELLQRLDLQGRLFRPCVVSAVGSEAGGHRLRKGRTQSG
jgi:hypothetical protein